MKTVNLGPGFSYRRRSNGIFQLRVYDGSRPKGDQRKEVSLRTDSPSLADQRAREYYNRYRIGEWSPWGAIEEGLTIKEAWKRYERAKRGHMRVKTLSDYRRVIDVLLSSCGLTWASALSSVTQDDVHDLLGRDVSDSTRETYYAKSRAFFSWCVSTRLIQSNPVSDIPKPPKSDPIPDGLSREQLDTLLDTVSAFRNLESHKRHYHTPHLNPEWAENYFRLVAAFGLRPSEAVRLTWRDIQAEGFILVRATKTRSERMVTVTPMGEDALARCRVVSACKYVATNHSGESPVSASYANRIFRRAREAAGLDETLTLYSLRHTYAREYRIRGGALHMLGSEMGHRDLRTTQKYGNINPSIRADYTRSLFEKADPSKQPKNGDSK